MYVDAAVAVTAAALLNKRGTTKRTMVDLLTCIQRGLKKQDFSEATLPYIHPKRSEGLMQ